MSKKNLTLRYALQRNKGGKFVLPFDAGWTPEGWKLATDEFAPHDEATSKLVELGIHLGQRCEPIWKSIHEISATIAPPLLIANLVTRINSLFLEESKADLSQLRTSGGRYIPNNEEMVRYIDGLGSFLFSRKKASFPISTSIVLAEGSFQHTSIPEGVETLIEELRNLFFIRFIFERHLFLGGEVVIRENGVTLATDESEHGRIYHRQSEMAWSISDMQHLRAALGSSLSSSSEYLIVTGIDGSGRIELGRISDNPRASRIAHLRNKLRSEYLFATLEQNNGAMDIVVVWDILHSLFYAMCEIVFAGGSIFPTLLPRRMLKNLIVRATDFTPLRASRALDELTFSYPSKDGLWSRPLVKVDSEKLAVVIPAILLSDPVRFVALTLLNLDLGSARGEQFEVRCIEQVEWHIPQSLKPIVTHLSKDHPIYNIIGRRSRQTDLILMLGQTILLCEAKSVGSISDAREFHQAMERIEEAAGQLHRREQVLRKNSIKVNSCLQLRSSAELEVVRVIISNHYFFDGIAIDGCIITSLATLCKEVKNISRALKHRKSRSPLNHVARNYLLRRLCKPQDFQKTKPHIENKIGSIIAPIDGWVTNYNYTTINSSVYFKD